MSWTDEVKAGAASRGRPTIDADGGVGIEFTDGFDVFWLLPGEVTSTVPISRDASPSVERLLATFDDVDKLRDQAVRVLRHHLASLKIAVSRSRNGQWGLTYKGGASSTFSVGAGLTQALMETRHVVAAIGKSIEGTWGISVPLPMQMELYLNATEPPADFVLPSEEPKRSSSSVRTATWWLGVCRVLDSPNPIRALLGLLLTGPFRGRAGPVLKRIEARLPHVEASVDILKKGTIDLAFTDGRDSFQIQIHEPEFLRQSKRQGAKVLGDSLADEYLALDAARTRVLNAIRRAAAARGWSEERAGMALLSNQRSTFLGATTREVQFDDGAALTALLKAGSPEAALRTMFTSHADFAEECSGRLDDPTPAPELPTRQLAPSDLPAPIALPELNSKAIAAMDAFAAETLATHLREGERVLHEYRERDRFDPAIDTWATMADWVGVADRNLEDESPPATAIVILLDAGDPRGDEMARKLLIRAEPHHEVSDDAVELVWRYRHEFPKLATRWFAPQQHDDVPFSRQRAELGDPIATRFIEAGQSDAETDEDDLTSAQLPRLPIEQQERVHQALLDWARTNHRWSPAPAEKLRLAGGMNWHDVAAALEENPFLLAGLFTTERRPDQFDEPGLLMSEEFVLVWSRYAPSPFLARLLLLSRDTDLLALANQASENSVRLNPSAADGVAIAKSVYGSWLEKLQPSIAIAWTRCRRAIDTASITDQ